jgi:hypothetical protein
MKSLVICAVLAFGCEAAFAQQPCPAKPTDLVQRPLLNGLVKDGARDADFEWISSARYMSGAWRITHSVCNVGKSPLVLSWPKTSIYAGALAAIPPGNPIVVMYTIPTEPVAHDSPIAYGFAPYHADASSYQWERGKQKVTQLNSAVFGVVAESQGSGKPRIHDVQMIFDVDREAEGYLFRVNVKNEASLNLIIGINSTQNDAFIQAFKGAGLDVRIIAPSDMGVEKREFVTAPVSKLVGLRNAVFIRARHNTAQASTREPSDVEVATVALFNAEYKPVIFGKVSIFQ